MKYDLIVIGGGAAGFFGALSAKAAHPQARVLLLEKTAALLAKVRISGGGRCNVTHACFDPLALSRHYPRGSNELIGPFHRFQPRDTIHWFEARGVPLKTESDGRIFPTTDSSQTIIDCLLAEANALGVEIRLRQKIGQIEKTSTGFAIDNTLHTHRLLLATGNSPNGHAWATSFGHTIQSPVPSLFTFNVPTSPLADLSGISHSPVELTIHNHRQKGPLLITHFGFSGPAALKLSAWGARDLHACNYTTDLAINWLPDLSEEQIYASLSSLKTTAPQKTLSSENPFLLPKNLWKKFVPDKRLHDIPLSQLRALAHKLHRDIYPISGKTTHKEEFVTCGGITLKEVDFKTMQSKLLPNLHFAGEILDIDGITGGFNFQSAWTTGFLAGLSIL